MITCSALHLELTSLNLAPEKFEKTMLICVIPACFWPESPAASKEIPAKKRAGMTKRLYFII